MRLDPLAEAAARRHELARAMALQALRELDRAGSPVTLAGVSQRATEASLRSRLTAALDRNKELAGENTRLRRQLARARRPAIRKASIR